MSPMQLSLTNEVYFRIIYYYNNAKFRKHLLILRSGDAYQKRTRWRIELTMLQTEPQDVSRPELRS